MGTPGLTQSQAQAETPSHKVEAQAQVETRSEVGVEQPLTVSELIDRVRKTVEDLNSDGVEPRYRIMRSPVNGGRVVFEIWLVHEVRSVDIASEVAANQICETVELSPTVCRGLRSKVKELVLKALGEDYATKNIVALKIRSNRGTFSIAWSPLEPVEDPVSGGYLVGAKINVIVELPAYKGIEENIAWLLGRLEEMLYNVY